MRVKCYFFSNNDKVVTSIWGIGSQGNSSAVLACLWDVILAVGHCLTGILRAILKKSKNAVSKLQLTRPELFLHGDHTCPLTPQESFFNVPVKINNGEKRWDEGYSCHFELTSDQPSWETGLWASPIVLAATLVGPTCAQSVSFPLQSPAGAHHGGECLERQMPEHPAQNGKLLWSSSGEKQVFSAGRSTWCEKFHERDSVPHKMEVTQPEITHWNTFEKPDILPLMRTSFPSYQDIKLCALTGMKSI